MQTVGSTLQAMRIRRGRTVDELSAHTRIPKRIILAVEGDQFSILPAPAYVKGFIRSICRDLGYDDSDVVHLYETMLFSQENSPQENAPMLVLRTQATDQVASAPAQGLRMAHAALLFVAALTFLAAILTATFREEASPHQRPGASIRTADTPAGSVAIPAEPRR